ncbi:MAG: HNH endonuclease signature motif containing protein [Vagococcus sp.]
MSIKKQCNHAGCRILIDYDSSYCDKHKKRDRIYKKDEYSKRKAKDEKYLRLYNSKRWRTTSKIYRINHPICENCLSIGIIKPVDVVDHIIEVKDDWNLRYEETNLQSLCHNCHNQKTINERIKRNSTP